MVTLQNKKTGEKRTWATDNADIVARLVRVGWVVVGEGLPPEVAPPTEEEEKADEAPPKRKR